MARKIGLFLLILVAGGAVDAAWFIRRDVGVNIGSSGCHGGYGRFSGPAYSFQAEQRHPLAKGDTLEVVNTHGDVNVSQGGASEVRVVVRKVVYRQTEAEARELADQVRLVIDGSGRVRVTTNRDDLERSRPDTGFESHLDVSVPGGVSVVVRNEHGSVSVADVAAAQIDDAHSEVRVERVAGAVQVNSQHADISISEVRGALTLTSRHGDVEVSDVEGVSSLDTEHGDVTVKRVHAATLEAKFGTLRFEDVRGDLEVRAQHAEVEADAVDGKAAIATSMNGVTVRRVSGEAHLATEHGSIDATDVGGPLQASASFEDVTLSQVAGPVDVTVTHGGVRARLLQKGGRVTASGGTVVVDGFAGPLEIQNERGDVELHPASALREPLIARTTFGEVRVQVPPGSQMHLDAASPGGELDIDVPGLALTRGDGPRATGVMGTAANDVRLFADHGRVRVSPALGKTDASTDGDDDKGDQGDKDDSSES